MLADVGDDPDHREPRLVGVEVELLPHRLLLAPQPPRHRLVDQPDRRRLRVVAGRQRPSVQQRNAQGAQELGRHRPHAHRAAVRGQLAPRQFESEADVARSHRQPVDDRRRLDSRHRRGAFGDTLEIDPAGHLIAIAAGHRLEIQGQDPFGLEADVDVEHFAETLDQEPGADRQHHRQSDLGGDQELVGALARHREAAGAGGERRAQVETPGPQRGQNAEGQTGDHGQDQGEEHHRPVDSDRRHPRHRRRQMIDQRAQCPPAGQDPQDSAEQRQQGALGEDLGDQTPAAGAEHAAQRQLAAAAGDPHQQEAGDVGAGDQQHQADAAEQDDECRAHVADQVVVPGHDGGVAQPGEIVRPHLFVGGHGGAKVLGRAFAGGARRQPAHHRVGEPVPVLPVGGIDRDRDPDLR